MTLNETCIAKLHNLGLAHKNTSSVKRAIGTRRRGLFEGQVKSGSHGISEAALAQQRSAGNAPLQIAAESPWFGYDRLVSEF
jgi:hypothetical protein